MAAHRFWRLVFVGAPKSASHWDSAANINLVELVLATTVGGPSVAAGGTASARSGGAPYEPSKAFDGSPSTSWRGAGSAGSGGIYIQYDFGAAPKDIVEIGVRFKNYGGSNGDPPTSFILLAGPTESGLRVVSAWHDMSVTDDTEKRYPLSLLPDPTGRVGIIPLCRRIGAPELFRPTTLRAVGRQAGTALPLRKLPFSGVKRVAGSTTVEGIPSPRRVQLHAQRTGVLIAEASTGQDGRFEFTQLADTTYTLIGVDVSGNHNSVIFAHVKPTD